MSVTVPTEGLLQALYPIPRAPVEVIRPPEGDRGTTQVPSDGEAKYQAYVAARGPYFSALSEWAAAFRPVTGLIEDQYKDDRLAELARSARAMLAAELGDLSPADGGEYTEWIGPDGTVYRARRIPDDVMRVATGYLVRALHFDGISKGDVFFWSKADRIAEMTDWTQSDSPGYVKSLPDNLQSGKIREHREQGPRGTNRLIDRSGAMRMIAPYVRRRLVEVL